MHVFGHKIAVNSFQNYETKLCHPFQEPRILNIEKDDWVHGKCLYAHAWARHVDQTVPHPLLREGRTGQEPA